MLATHHKRRKIVLSSGVVRVIWWSAGISKTPVGCCKILQQPQDTPKLPMAPEQAENAAAGSSSGDAAAQEFLAKLSQRWGGSGKRWQRQYCRQGGKE